MSGPEETNSMAANVSWQRGRLEVYLDAIANRPAARDMMAALAGQVAAAIKSGSSGGSSPQVAALYLQAAARHLEAGFLSSSSSSGGSGALQYNTAITAVATVMAASVAAAPMEAERRHRADDFYTVVDAIGHCVTRCSTRSVITQSGILPVMANLVRPNESRAAGVPWTGLIALSNLHVEFLQACLYAGQYRYAERMIQDTWPLPSPSVTVRHVLRYYYLRGTIHMGCSNWKMAVRSFWACLSVPSDMCSAIAIAAWKKLVLVQCLVLSHQILDVGGVLALPSGAPSCLGRYLDRAVPMERRSQQPHQSVGYYPHGPQIPQEDRPEVTHMVESNEGENTTEEGLEGVQQRQTPLSGNNTRTVYPSLGVRVYMDLVHSFVKIERTAFAEVVSRHASLFLRDGNMGMVKQCESELVRRQIYHLSRIYCTATMPQLSTMLGLPEDQVQKLLLQVSMERAWRIEIDDGVVTFPVLTEAPGDESAEVDELMRLSNAIYKLDATISSSQKYTAMISRPNPSSSESASAPRGVEEI